MSIVQYMALTACHFSQQSLTEGDQDEEETDDSDQEEEPVRYARANDKERVLGLPNDVIMLVSQTNPLRVEFQ